MLPRCRTPSPRLPRASGDRPSSRRGRRCAGWAAPRERGSTHAVAVGRGSPRGCPARAGIDPPHAWPSPPCERLPRASGDRPKTEQRIELITGAAPRERGSTTKAASRAACSWGCPARAGIDPTGNGLTSAPCGLPRASGDRPARRKARSSASAAAPRERGSTRRDCRHGPGRPGCPARAGIDPWWRIGELLVEWLPRASGDRPHGQSGTRASGVAAPRERGSTQRHAHHVADEVGCPARAGIDLAWSGRAPPLKRLPRASGDRPSVRGLSSLGVVAAPRERGSTRRSPLAGRLLIGCPARAGIDPSGGCCRADYRRLPRASGDRPGRG